MQKEKRNKVLIVLLFVQIGIIYLLSYFPNFVEKYYTNGIYILISSFLRTIFGWVPFSIGDILYAFIIAFLLRFIVLIIKKRFKNIKPILFQLGAFISILYFCFYLFWGINYSRPSIIHSLDIESKETASAPQTKGESTGMSDIKKLENLTDKLIDRLLSLQMELVPHDSLAVQVPYSKSEILERTSLGYKNLSQTFAQFKYKPSSIKKSLFSLPLIYMGFAGYLNPFTGEAQVDYLIPKTSLPMTSSHEVAHQLGIASESEANFIGFLAASFHDDKYFQYSAYLSAFRYALHDIYIYDAELYKRYIEKIPPGIKKNIRENQEFWKRYENPVEPLFKIFYDNYLKVNQQKSGLLSYNQMVDLLIAYDAKYPL